MADTIRLVCQRCGLKVEAPRDARIDPPEAVRCETTSCCECDRGDFVESFYFDANGKDVDADPMRWTAEPTDGEDEAPYVCPGCHAVAEPCAPGCIDASMEAERREAIESGDYDDSEDYNSDEEPTAGEER